MSLFDNFNNGNTNPSPDNKNPFGNMFSSNTASSSGKRESDVKDVQEPRYGRKPNKRPSLQVTTRLYEDNKDWVVQYAESRGIHTGQIAYVLNMLIDKERGLQ